MKTKIFRVNRSLFISSLALFLLVSTPTAGFADEPCVFERMWPSWQHPWYFNGPYGISVDDDDNVWVFDSGHGVKFTADGQFVSKFSVGEGFDIATDLDGNIYVAQPKANRIGKLSQSGELIGEWDRNGTGNGEFQFPCSVAVDSFGDVYVVDADNNRVQKFDKNGQFITKWGSFGSGNGQFNFSDELLHTHLILPRIATDGINYVYVSDSFNHRIQKFTLSGDFVRKWGSEGTGNGQFHHPSGIDVDAYVLDSNNYRVQKFTSSGIFVTQWGGEGEVNGKFAYPGSIAVSPSGSVYVLDLYAHNIQKFSSDGTFLLKWGSEGNGDGEFMFPRGLATDKTGNVYVADEANHRIQKFTPNGEFITKWGTQGTGEEQFLGPLSVCVGPDNRVYVGDVLRVQVFSNGDPPPMPKSAKAIIMAGGGPYEQNNLWDATRMCANYAYRALTYQGYTKENLYYLSADTGLDPDGNGIANEKTDKDIASLIRIGNETKSAGDVPVIGSVSPPQDLQNNASALIYADQVVDADGISRVWAVITPPGYSPGSSETPVTDLPSIDLASVGSNRFEANYTQFTSSGTYNISVFALDRKGVLSLPVQTSVTRSTNCLTVGNDLGIRVPCAEYNGSRYSFLLDFYRHPDDPSGFYWKLVMGSLSATEGMECIPIGLDLNMPMPCVCYRISDFGLRIADLRKRRSCYQIRCLEMCCSWEF